MAVPAAPVQVPSQRPLASNVTSVTSVANDMIPGAVHRSPDIFLTSEENPGKPFDELAVQPVIASNWVLYLQMSSLATYSKSGWA